MTDRGTIVAELQAATDALAAEVARLPASAAHWRPAEGEWSQAECLTHIWVCEHFIFLPRMQAMARETNPHLPVVDEVALQREHYDPAGSRDDLLAAIQADRAAELALLTEANWGRPGVHAALGPISVGWVAQYALGHTWEHLSQMLRVRLMYALRGEAQAASEG